MSIPSYPNTLNENGLHRDRAAAFARPLLVTWVAGVLLFLMVVAFFWFNVRSLRSFEPWTDDVMMVDPAVNLYLGKGWDSTVWYHQSKDTFWAANNPLYPVLVYGWLKVFGYSLEKVHSLNFFLVLVGAAFVVDASRRLQLVRRFWSLCLLALLILFDFSISFVYSAGRCDLTTMVAFAILFWVYALPLEGRKRWLFLGLAATPLVSTGIQAIPYLFALFVVLSLITRRIRYADFGAILIGSTVGGLVMLGYFGLHHAIRPYLLETLASHHTIIGSAAKVHIVGNSKAISHFSGQLMDLLPNRAFKVIVEDKSILPMCAFLLVVLFLYYRRDRSSRIKTLALAGLGAAVVVPYFLLAAGRYVIYYHWMGAVPVAVFFAACLEESWFTRRKALTILGAVLACAAIVLGVPRLWLSGWRHSNPPDYHEVNSIVQRDTTPGETIYGDYVFYYASQSSGHPFYSVDYAGSREFPRMTDQERSQVKILMLRPEFFQAALAQVGGEWTRVGTETLPYGFQVGVWRRVPGSAI